MVERKLMTSIKLSCLINVCSTVSHSMSTAEQRSFQTPSMTTRTVLFSAISYLQIFLLHVYIFYLFCCCHCICLSLGTIQSTFSSIYYLSFLLCVLATYIFLSVNHFYDFMILVFSLIHVYLFVLIFMY